MGRLGQLAQDFSGFALVMVLLVLVTLLPPDTSLQEVRKAGTLRACVPTYYPPLVTGDPEAPGIDVELLAAIAEQLDVSLTLNEIPSIGRDFNPRNWRVTRAHCQVIAGGVVDSDLTRSFLETAPPYAETGWAILAPKPLATVEGLTVGTLASVSGLDRIGLGRYLRRSDVKIRVVSKASELVEGLVEGRYDAGVTEAMLARHMAAEHDWWTGPLASELERYNLVLGLWKGDLTLQRAITSAFESLEESGELDAILTEYVGRDVSWARAARGIFTPLPSH